jgi:hypothetical protein
MTIKQTEKLVSISDNLTTLCILINDLNKELDDAKAANTLMAAMLSLIDIQSKILDLIQL